MAPFSQFVNRIANYVANEVLIKGLANSRTFQRFAVRTDKSFKELHKASTETINSTLEDLSKKAADAAVSGGGQAAGGGGPPKPPLTGFPGFASAFYKEVRKDLGMGAK